MPVTVAPHSLTPQPPRVKRSFISIDATDTLTHINTQMQHTHRGNTPEAPDTESQSSSASSPTAIMSFPSTARDVFALGSTGLARWDKKAYERQRRLKQGLQPDKRIKTPLPMLVAMKRKNSQRREKKIARERDSGLKVKSASSSDTPARRHNEDAIRHTTRDDGLLRVPGQVGQQLLKPRKSLSLAKRMRAR